MALRRYSLSNVPDEVGQDGYQLVTLSTRQATNEP